MEIQPTNSDLQSAPVFVKMHPCPCHTSDPQETPKRYCRHGKLAPPESETSSSASFHATRKPDRQRMLQMAQPKWPGMKFTEMMLWIEADRKKRRETWLRNTQAAASSVRVEELAVPFPGTVKATKSQYCSVINDYHYNNLSDTYAKAVHLYGEPIDGVTYKRNIVHDQPSFDKMKAKCDTFYNRYRKQTKKYQEQAAKNILANIESIRSAKLSNASKMTAADRNTSSGSTLMQSVGSKASSRVVPMSDSMSRASGKTGSIGDSKLKRRVKSKERILSDESYDMSMVPSKGFPIVDTMVPPTKIDEPKTERLVEHNLPEIESNVNSRTLASNELLNTEKFLLKSDQTEHPYKLKTNDRKSSLTIIKTETKETIAGSPTSSENLDYPLRKHKPKKHRNEVPPPSAMARFFGKLFGSDKKPAAAQKRPKPGTLKGARSKAKGGKVTTMNVEMPVDRKETHNLTNSTKKSLRYLSAKDPEFFNKFFGLDTSALTDDRPRAANDSFHEMDTQLNMLGQQMNEIIASKGVYEDNVKCYAKQRRIVLPENPLSTADPQFFNQIIYLDDEIPPTSSYSDLSVNHRSSSDDARAEVKATVQSGGAWHEKTEADRHVDFKRSVNKLVNMSVDSYKEPTWHDINGTASATKLVSDLQKMLRAQGVKSVNKTGRAGAKLSKLYTTDHGTALKPSASLANFKQFMKELQNSNPKLDQDASTAGKFRAKDFRDDVNHLSVRQTASASSIQPSGKSKSAKKATLENDSQSPPSLSNGSQDAISDSFTEHDKAEVLRFIGVQSEIFRLQKKINTLKRQRTLARLAQPRVVSLKHVEKQKLYEQMQRDLLQRKVSFAMPPSERIQQLAVPRLFRETVKRDKSQALISTSKRFQLRREDRAEQLAVIRDDRLKFTDSLRMHDGYPASNPHGTRERGLRKTSSITVGPASVLKETPSDTVIRLAVYLDK